MFSVVSFLGHPAHGWREMVSVTILHVVLGDLGCLRLLSNHFKFEKLAQIPGKFHADQPYNY
jgi:hypothetical protein